jgi:hypothetical protein
MRRCLVLAAIVCVSTLGCSFDRHRHDRPARFLLGTNARDLATSSGAVALRTGSPTEVAPLGQEARTVSGQFTMATRYHGYAGVELEAGTLDVHGSNFGGAYGVLGAEHLSRFGSLGVELVSGWRGLRHGLGEDDVNTFVAEPRVRGQLRIADQVTAGAVAGATLGEQGAWMAGIYLGFHSRAFGP